MMAGFLLARAGVDVIVLEKHADFFRDFRGDTIHPSTLNVLNELGLLQRFLQVPHSEARELSARFGSTAVPIADFSHVPGPCKFIGFMPQWDFLNFIAAEAKTYPNFRLEMEAEVTDLAGSGGAVTGVRAVRPEGGRLTVEADLVIAADGRTSVLRDRAGLRARDLGAPIDVLWMRLSRKPDDPSQALGSAGAGALLILIDRNDYFQCGFVIAKGGYAALKARGLPDFRAQILSLAPFLGERVDELQDWDQIKLLSVALNRLDKWYVPHLLCIGDAAHAMSPIGGVGINLAIQDAVAAANILSIPLARGPVPVELLAEVQSRRELAVKLVQGIQSFIQRNFVSSLLSSHQAIPVPPLVRLLGAVPYLRRIPAYLIGIGFRPENVRSPSKEAG